MDRSMRQCGGIFLTTVAIAVALRCAWEVWPGTLFGIVCTAEHQCVGTVENWAVAGIAAAVLYHVPLRDKSSLCAYLMVPAALPVALLFVYWFLRMVCGICSALVDVVVWICLLAVGEATAHSVRQTAFAGRALPMVGMLLLIWAFSYTLFSLHGADLPIFTETMLSLPEAWAVW